MPATIMYGAPLAKQLKQKLTGRFADCGSLKVISVGNQPASRLYLAQLTKLAASLGVGLNHLPFTELEHPQHVIETIHGLNANQRVSGIMVQLPLPKSWKQQDVLAAISPLKDVDGMRYAAYYPNHVLPATAEAVISLLSHYGIPTLHQRIGFVGFTPTLNIPLCLYFAGHENFVFALQAGTAAHHKLSTMDIVISAAGVKWLITPDMIKKDAVVVDVGITQMDDGIYGDVHPDVEEKTSFFAPSLKGVGPITNALIFDHLLKLHEARQPS